MNDKLTTAIETAAAALQAVVAEMRAAEPAPATVKPQYEVGQQVRVISKIGTMRHYLAVGAIGKIVRYDPRDNTYMIESGKYHQWLGPAQFEVYQEDVKPAAPALKYKVGDYALVPCKVVYVNPASTLGLSYRVAPIGNPNDRTLFARAALEPEAPKVGDTCLFWDDDISEAVNGKLTRDDGEGDDPRYECENDEYFFHCLKLNE